MSESLVEHLETDRKRLLDRLAIVTGLFGTRGWAEIEVHDDGQDKVMAVSEEVNDKVQYARKVLGEFGRKPRTD